MISILQVRPTTRELRPLQRGWGAMHWVMCIPMLVPFMGLWALAIWGVGPYPDGRVLFGALIGTPLVWIAARYLAGVATRRAGARAPASALPTDWRLDNAGIEISTALTSSRLSWPVLFKVIEEADRFVFLVSPPTNPVLPKRVLTANQLTALRALIVEVRASGRLGRGVD